MSEWIRPKDNLPKEYENVLLYVDDGRSKYITFGYMLSISEDILEFNTFGDEYFEVSDVLYWMPLPEPPKGESNTE